MIEPLMQLFVVLAFATPAPEGSVACDVVEPSVTIFTPVAAGTGTLIEYKGELLILTAAHVAEDLYTPRVDLFINEKGEPVVQVNQEPLTADIITSDGRSMKARPVWYSPKWSEAGGVDLALLRPLGSTRGIRPALVLTEKDAAPELGEDLYYCGFGGGIFENLEKSIVNKVAEDHIRTNGIGFYGHSGSGVYLKREGRWKLAGVLVRFAMDPRANWRSPMECESRVVKFLDSYIESKKGS